MLQFLASVDGCCGGLLPENFWQGLLGTVIYFLVALALLPVAYKIVDKITPGDLAAQLLGTEDKETGQPAGRQPNIALAVFAGFLALGMCHIIASAIK